MANILGLAGSPRKGGNSDLLLEAFLNGARRAGADTEKVYLNDLRMRPCQACDACARDGRCVLKDDMQDLYPKVAGCSGLVLATSITFGSLSAQAKAFIDRFQCWWHARYSLGKPFIAAAEKRPAFFIGVGALPKTEYCASALAIAGVFFYVVNLHPAGNLCYRGFDEKGSIRDHPTALQEAGEAGLNFAIQIMGGSCLKILPPSP